MTKLERRIHKYLTKWQRKLRLNDWRIKLIVVKKNEANPHRDSGAFATTRTNPTLKSAIISVMEPGDELMETELEATVIHELIHLHLDPYPWGEDRCRDTIVEQGVDSLAISFLKLDNPEWVDPRHNI